MIDPRLALSVAVLITGLFLLAFWPDRGLWWRLRLVRQTSERVRIEDALKHLFKSEYEKRGVSLESVAGALTVSTHTAAELLARMEELELVRSGERFRLTPEGRSYALRVIRNHRLWERHFSDETGLAPANWHLQADVLEHRTSPEEAEEMAARLGHPTHDPHGDPIPTRAGEIVPHGGRALGELGVDGVGEIVHIEDEPPEVYAQLVAEGLHPGMQVRVLEVSPQRVRFDTDAGEHVLAPVVAANISVQPLAEEEAIQGPHRPLSRLDLGEEAQVIGFAPSCRGIERRRLLDLGLIPGTTVKAEIRSPGGDPTGYRIRGAVIALRREQADHIQIEAPQDASLHHDLEVKTA